MRVYISLLCGKKKQTIFTHFVTKLPNTNTIVTNEFVITDGNIQKKSFLDLIRKYISLNPQSVICTKFFVKLRCTSSWH